ncbi:glycerol-3-phosphate 1-O-acyltransferase PlsY [Bacillus fonticola]|uniref:glycerol-3-phosphate 1-O-acyltransferase PlsY n=1 Tax=Bacillus fonticola TaxID=2728853 RepID=UPI00147580D3|nr:glycerol-3-phosphate 1-O-acyltransferase PlsY [Bacillus fonticola]
MEIVGVIIVSYLLGSISFALLIGRVFYGVDLREHGSKNLGATNAVSCLGWKAGVAVLLGDAGKGVAAVWIATISDTGISPLLAGMIAVVGHCFPVFARFKGGKAVATTAGVLILVAPFKLVLGLLIFFGLIWVTKYVVIGSLGGVLSLVVFSFYPYQLEHVLTFAALFLVMIYLHRSNLRNLINKQEPTIYDGKRIAS